MRYSRQSRVFQTVILAASLVSSLFAGPGRVDINWLDGAAPAPGTPASFGIPWERGLVKPGQKFELKSKDGESLPLQSWPLAYWPDGSAKWTGFATVAAGDCSGPLILEVGTEAPEKTAGVTVDSTGLEVVVDTGHLRCVIPRAGENLFSSLSADGRVVARDAGLECIVQDGPDGGPADTPKRTLYTGNVEKVTVEQAGPVRAVVRFNGMHRSAATGRAWMPFVVRLYFYVGSGQVRMVHTLIYDGVQEKDIVRGLAVTAMVPLREEVQNRQVRFSGAGGGLWSEPVQPLVGRQGRYVGYPESARGGAKPVDVYPDQIEGKRVPNRDQVDEHGRNLMSQWAVWDGFKLIQPNADGFTIVKRTNSSSSWLAAGAGQRASGLVFVGDSSGGLAVAIRNFWQSYPASLEVEGAASGLAEVTAWLWSPDGGPMDMRHYDTRAHGLEEAYEDVQPGMSTATGVARTSELTLFVSGGMPSKAESSADAALAQSPEIAVPSPEYIHSTGVFGIWSLPNRATAFGREVESRLDAEIKTYEREVEQRRWYGFWTYGNVMHSYDDVRHVWRYDLGGMAWDNTELATDSWLWYSFLRTGRSDIFRLAEAMTRNTSEVDVYHTGRLAGLGSRHNVVPWGDGAKEARISQAAFKRFYYYLTTDERVGDLMREVLNVDYKVAEVDPMREAQPETSRESKFPARVRLGPDWFAFAGNWMTEWERTGDPRWRDKINAGMNDIARMPLGIRSGRNLVYGYEPSTGHLFQVSDELGDYNLATIQGGAEVIFELNDLIGNAAWERAWVQYCRLEQAPRDVILRDMITGNEGMDGSYAGPGRLAAYAYFRTRDKAFARVAIDTVEGKHGLGSLQLDSSRVEAPFVLNPIDEIKISTNAAAQTGLTAIEVLSMCADALPADAKAPSR